MKRIWPWIYAGLFLLSFLGGTQIFWNRSAPHAAPHSDAIIVCAIFGLVFPLLAVLYAKFRWKSGLKAPSFYRGFAGGWWTDPLQCLRLTNLLLVGSFVGSLFALNRADTGNDVVMHVYLNGALAIGFVLGDIVARYVFRNDIS